MGSNSKMSRKETALVMLCLSRVALEKGQHLLTVVNEYSYWNDVVHSMVEEGVPRDRAVYLIGGDHGAGGPGMEFASKLNSQI
jgi:hypothetical protein